MSLTQELIREVLDYDPDTGVFTWRRTVNVNAPAGSRAGCVGKTGYRVISIGNGRYFEHRLVWMYVYGKWPDGVIDHIDLDRANNAFNNLRDCDPSDNAKNRPGHKDSESGIKGVCKDSRRKTKAWYSQIMVDGEKHFLGAFRTSREAALAYNEAAIEYHGAFACLVVVPEEYGINTHPCA